MSCDLRDSQPTVQVTLRDICVEFRAIRQEKVFRGQDNKSYVLNGTNEELWF